MQHEQSSECQELQFWEVVLKFYADRPFHIPFEIDGERVPLRDEKGKLVPLIDENYDSCPTDHHGIPTDENGDPIPHLVVDEKVVRAETITCMTGSNNADHWWPEIRDKVEEGSVKMTVSKSLLDGDRINIDPQMARYLTAVEYKYKHRGGPEPILQGPNGETLYAPRFVIVRDAPKPDINWSSTARRALRNKYPDGELPEGARVTDVARDVLAEAAEIDSRLKDIISNFEKEAVEAMRKEITRQLTARRMERSRKRHLPTSAKRLQISSHP